MALVESCCLSYLVVFEIVQPMVLSIKLFLSSPSNNLLMLLLRKRHNDQKATQLKNKDVKMNIKTDRH
ncbi:hypothetical protein EXN66_Car014064 [Channa argus]|uniref:Uncharacterized protein n=1 Tax=Channa argus TaxID=215402 RepID=A0A6G1Q7S9_CHAAH|nr:hypothetical protein EXN66_Car014064 [Channa argus]